MCKYESIGELKSEMFGNSANTCYIGKKSFINLYLQTQDRNPFSVLLSLISCELSSADDNELIACNIYETQLGNYNISFTPHTGGKHQLIVRLGGMDILGSHFTVLPEIRG